MMVLATAAFALMVCVPDDPKGCVPLEETYTTMAECHAAIEDLTQFWIENMGERPQIPMHCKDTSEGDDHT